MSRVVSITRTKRASAVRKGMTLCRRRCCARNRVSLQTCLNHLARIGLEYPKERENSALLVEIDYVRTPRRRRRGPR